MLCQLHKVLFCLSLSLPHLNVINIPLFGFKKNGSSKMNLLKSQLRLVNVNFPTPVSTDSTLLLSTREKKHSNIHEAC